ncbi:hypothetical protein [Priestia aryabhattai]|uniref:hypothetical protein n=1 Tax=Priestia aryabhattai TaxID=412384 RepID=UPI0032E90FDA
MPRKKLTKTEQQNNQVLKEMFNHIGRSGFKAAVTITDNRDVIFEGTAEDVELLIDRGIEFKFEEDLKAYKKLGLDSMYYLNEATITLKKYTSILKGLEITLNNSNIVFYIKPI